MVSFGRDAPARSGTWLLIGVALTCFAMASLVVGVLAGRPEPAGSSSAAGGSSSLPLVAGSITNVRGAVNGADFALPVFNPGEDDIEVTLVALGGWNTSLRENYPATIGPGGWGHVGFSAPADCRHPLPPSIGEVTLRVDTPTEPVETEASLLPDAAASTLLDYYEAYCADSRPIRPQQLAGVWIVEKAYGDRGRGEGIQLMRFSPDGSFVGDRQRGLFSRDPSVYGRYHLRGLTLAITRQGGHACSPGKTAWRATIRSDGRLSMAWRRGTCPDGPDDVWIARRILRDVGLPARPTRAAAAL